MSSRAHVSMAEYSAGSSSILDGSIFESNEKSSFPFNLVKVECIRNAWRFGVDGSISTPQ